MYKYNMWQRVVYKKLNPPIEGTTLGYVDPEVVRVALSNGVVVADFDSNFILKEEHDFHKAMEIIRNHEQSRLRKVQTNNQ